MEQQNNVEQQQQPSSLEHHLDNIEANIINHIKTKKWLLPLIILFSLLSLAINWPLPVLLIVLSTALYGGWKQLQNPCEKGSFYLKLAFIIFVFTTIISAILPYHLYMN